MELPKESPKLSTPKQSETPTELNTSSTTVIPESHKEELPNTGLEDTGSLASLGLVGLLSTFGLVKLRKKD